MTLLISLIIVMSSAFIGWQIKNYFASRGKFFSDVLLFCEVILNETNFNKTPIKSIIAKNEKAFHKDFLKAMSMFSRSLDQGEKYVDKSLILNKSEKEFFENFLNSLGRTDLQNHNNLVLSYRQSIANKIEKEMEREKNKGNAFFKISICVGVCIVVLCI